MSGSPVKFAARRLVQEAMAASLDSEKLKKMAEAQIGKAIGGDTRAFMAVRDTVDGPVKDQGPVSPESRLVDMALLGAARELLDRLPMPKKVEKLVGSGSAEPENA